MTNEVCQEKTLLTSCTRVHHACQCLTYIIKIFSSSVQSKQPWRTFFGFSKDVTRILYSMRDWKLEDVKRDGGTPSCLALQPYRVDNCGIQPGYWKGSYFIQVQINTPCSPHRFFRLEFYGWVWSSINTWSFRFSDEANPIFDRFHGPQVRVVPRRFYDSDLTGVANQMTARTMKSEFAKTLVHLTTNACGLAGLFFLSQPPLHSKCRL